MISHCVALQKGFGRSFRISVPTNSQFYSLLTELQGSENRKKWILWFRISYYRNHRILLKTGESILQYLLEKYSRPLWFKVLKLNITFVLQYKSTVDTNNEQTIPVDVYDATSTSSTTGILGIWYQSSNAFSIALSSEEKSIRKPVLKRRTFFRLPWVCTATY